MLSRRPTQAYLLVSAPTVTKGAAREQQPIPIFASKRIRSNIAAVLSDRDAWMTPAYSLALQAEHLLQVVERKRTHTERPRGRKLQKWGPEGRAALLADARSNDELAEAYGVSSSAIYQQRLIARREAA